MDATSKNVMELNEKRVYKCNVCDTVFKSSSKLSIHVATHNGTPLPKCDICDKTYTCKWYLKCHMQSHFKEYQCDICKKYVATEKSLRDHMLIHSDEMPFQCPHCFHSFRRKKCLEQHIQRCHTERERTCECDICNKKFYYQKNLKCHMKTHTGEVTYNHECNVCGKKYQTKACLEKHAFIHSKDKVIRCDICDKALANPAALRLHMQRIHVVADGKVECKICNKFINSYYLNAHMEVVHSSFKKHVCDVCNKTFSRSDYLLRHKTVHMDVKPHLCTICDRTFSRLQYLQQHVGKIHNSTKKRNSKKAVTGQKRENHQGGLKDVDDAAIEDAN